MTQLYPIPHILSFGLQSAFQLRQPLADLSVSLVYFLLLPLRGLLGAVILEMLHAYFRHHLNQLINPTPNLLMHRVFDNWTKFSYAEVDMHGISCSVQPQRTIQAGRRDNGRAATGSWKISSHAVKAYYARQVRDSLLVEHGLRLVLRTVLS